ncbi:hypothetical protein LSTR_LSTR008545 [Laodelphax striatellus]|uniref:Mitochondrial import receptor subunit TOM20 n=1 Tax=Laodelphax striatellus TaxID=195883 RepID=A0A482WRH8_LAOST|nr:hypothetical protein LSTR_LSTR008545 [Laodelphax striatellus]
MFSKGALKVAAGVCGMMFLGYCVYFDNKRRRNPNFKKNLNDKRRAKDAERRTRTKGSGRSRMDSNSENQFDAQAILFEELQSFGESMAQGDMTGCVDHLHKGLSVCQQPEILLQHIQQTLPPNVFSILEQRLSERQELQFQ